ncbi:helix-turn-helix domain-containing protein [Flavisolibacter nicotianae]|uniref:helix-turn-helix domain-containing protein n=1 Tax=Flavisolibacter nicotianae TaxID=2364882 RepID=UPI000EACF1FB|nr:helix-turn-helix domain-containing protein [Flavisolibacter nicotianae]
MAVEVVTREDLQAFRVQLLNDIRALIAEGQPKPAREWLKNSEVRRLLKVSSNTLQRLRIAGKLKSTKLGGVHYYRLDDIEQLLQSGA